MLYVGANDGLCRLIHTNQFEGPARETMQYIALSHAWGSGPPHFTCRTENLDMLSNGIAPSALPNTLRDAVNVTRWLGLHYLWIDALCIVQDSMEDVKVEVQKMEDIFSGAYFVLAGTSAEGMVSGFLEPRQEAKVAVLGGAIGVKDEESFIYVSNLVDDFDGDVLHAPLHSRAWTLQDRALARRTIFFAKNQTYFECGDSVRCETLTRMCR
jgi:hypothetical protein